MSDEWIKMRKNLRRHPKVVMLKRELDCSAATVVGALFFLWSVADEHSSDGVLRGYDEKTVDEECELPGFAKAMASRKVGWLRLKRTGVQVVDFSEHNGASAKARAENTKRQQRLRQDKGDADVAQPARQKRDHQRKEKNHTTPIAPSATPDRAGEGPAAGSGGGGGGRALPAETQAALKRLKVRADAWQKFPDDLTPNTVLRHWIDVHDNADEPTGALVYRLQQGRDAREAKAPTLKAVAKAITAGEVVRLNGQPVAGTAKYNSDGVVVDGQRVLAAGDVKGVVFA